VTSQTATRAWLGAVPIDAVGAADALERIAELVERGRGGTVFTPNVDHLLVAHEDAAFRQAYGSVDLSLVDGMPVLWLCRALGLRVREKVSGSDLVRPLMRLAAARGLRVYLLGAAPEVARRAAEILATETPGLQIVGISSPRVDMAQPASERDAIREQVRRARPDLVLVALGAPKAEKFSHECRDRLRPAVLVCVGAGLDFVAGVVRRAPRWMSACGLEWLFRLSQEPRRLWRRYLVRGPRALPLFIRLLRGRSRAGSKPAERAAAAGQSASRSA
jgi:N-acetylglucosaminyldiphosphoundecaprenol N-acetyl-beta-D-mannosaminyltransferase